jgi:hypothetical protein
MPIEPEDPNYDILKDDPLNVNWVQVNYQMDRDGEKRRREQWPHNPLMRWLDKICTVREVIGFSGENESKTTYRRS